jgi:hypothetical protein
MVIRRFLLMPTVVSSIAAPSTAVSSIAAPRTEMSSESCVSDEETFVTSAAAPPAEMSSEENGESDEETNSTFTAEDLEGEVSLSNEFVARWKADPEWHTMAKKWRRKARHLMMENDKVSQAYAVMQAQIDRLFRSSDSEDFPPTTQRRPSYTAPRQFKSIRGFAHLLDDRGQIKNHRGKHEELGASEDDEGSDYEEGDEGDDENEDGVSGLAPAAVDEGDGENEYRARRQENIKKNEAYLASIMWTADWCKAVGEQRARRKYLYAKRKAAAEAAAAAVVEAEAAALSLATYGPDHVMVGDRLVRVDEDWGSDEE